MEIRLATDEDRLQLARLFAAVAEERDGIAAEPPVDVERHAAGCPLDRTFVAVSDGTVIGRLHVEPPSSAAARSG